MARPPAMSISNVHANSRGKGAVTVYFAKKQEQRPLVLHSDDSITRLVTNLTFSGSTQGLPGADGVLASWDEANGGAIWLKEVVRQPLTPRERADQKALAAAEALKAEMPPSAIRRIVDVHWRKIDELRFEERFKDLYYVKEAHNQWLYREAVVRPTNQYRGVYVDKAQGRTTGSLRIGGRMQWIVSHPGTSIADQEQVAVAVDRYDVEWRCALGLVWEVLHAFPWAFQRDLAAKKDEAVRAQQQSTAVGELVAARLQPSSTAGATSISAADDCALETAVVQLRTAWDSWAAANPGAAATKKRLRERDGGQRQADDQQNMQLAAKAATVEPAMSWREKQKLARQQRWG